MRPVSLGHIDRRAATLSGSGQKTAFPFLNALTTTRVREAGPSDENADSPGDSERWPAAGAIYEPAVVESTLSLELTAPNGAEMGRRVAEITARLPRLVAEADTVLGYACASPHRVRSAYAWCVEVSIYTAPEAHRQGIGRALYTSLFSVLRLQGFQNAYAVVTVPNPVSNAFHEAMGFAFIATYPRVGYKLGRWFDTRWYGRALGQHPLDPPAPQSLPELLGSPALEEALRAGLPAWRTPETD